MRLSMPGAEGARAGLEYLSDLCALCGSFQFFLTSIRPENRSGLMTLLYGLFVQRVKLVAAVKPACCRASLATWASMTSSSILRKRISGRRADAGRQA